MGACVHGHFSIYFVEEEGEDERKKMAMTTLMQKTTICHLVAANKDGTPSVLDLLRGHHGCTATRYGGCWGHLCLVSEDVLHQAPTLHAILEHLAEVPGAATGSGMAQGGSKTEVYCSPFGYAQREGFQGKSASLTTCTTRFLLLIIDGNELSVNFDTAAILMGGMVNSDDYLNHVY